METKLKRVSRTFEALLVMLPALRGGSISKFHAAFELWCEKTNGMYRLSLICEFLEESEDDLFFVKLTRETLNELCLGVAHKRPDYDLIEQNIKLIQTAYPFSH